MSYGPGPCFKCRKVVERFDDLRRRFACVECMPEATWAETVLAQFHVYRDDERAAVEMLHDLPARLPHETRQQWRARCREADRGS